MSYQLTVIQKPGYLHAIVTGSNSKENVIGYLQDLMRECELRSSDRVLIEERLAGPRVGTLDAFSIASENSAQAHGRFEAIAYVDRNAEGDLMKFAETVAVNRGLPLRLFSSVAEAEKWLAEKPGEG
ncbi:MAG: hypothetical protein PHU46_04755 [Rhodocyclaceae bacterium]|nr:hypothetical protein [Rhodocyclaceae bacterium]